MVLCFKIAVMYYGRGENSKIIGLEKPLMGPLVLPRSVLNIVIDLEFGEDKVACFVFWEGRNSGLRTYRRGKTLRPKKESQEEISPHLGLE